MSTNTRNIITATIIRNHSNLSRKEGRISRRTSRQIAEISCGSEHASLGKMVKGTVLRAIRSK
jgi:ribosomal protein L14